MYEGPQNIAAMFIEPVTGTNGILPPPEGYLKGWISNPHPPMPNFNLTRQTVDDLVAYIRSLGEGSRAIQKR